MTRLGIRRRLVLVVVAAVAGAVAALVVGFNLVLWRMLDNNSHDVLRSRAAAEIATLQPIAGDVRWASRPWVPHLTGTYGCSREGVCSSHRAARAPR